MGNNTSCVLISTFLALKVPKRQNFSLVFFTLSEVIRIGDLGTGKKLYFFITWPLISMVFVFLPHAECTVNKEKVEAWPILKVCSGYFWAHIDAYNVFLKNFQVLVLF
jgi:hypothetical protein